MNTFHFILPLFFSLVIYSCSSGQDKLQTNEKMDDGQESVSIDQSPVTTQSIKVQEQELSQEINGFTYQVKYMSAIDFLERKGENIDPDDLNNLKKEQVFMLEISSENEYKDIFENSKINMNKDDAINFLGGAISTDFTVIQNKKEFVPNGVSFEGIFTEKNKLRCVFFISGLELGKKFHITFYDRLFQAGLMKFNS